MSPLEQQTRHWLGVMATGELAERETHYPKRVEQGRMTEDEAATTIRIWSAIATLFAQRQVTTRLSWAELEHELARAFAKLHAISEAKPQDKLIRDRLGAVHGMLDRVRWHRQLAMAPASEQGRDAA